MIKTPDFVAILNYLSTEEGGRTTAAFSGYRPHVKFPFSEMLTSGRQVFLDRDIVLPGGMVTAEIAVISPEFFQNRLNVGSKFEFCEGARIIGTGIIIKVINPELLEQ